MMACLAVGDKKADDAKLEPFLPIIKREAWDNRNFVKKKSTRIIAVRTPVFGDAFQGVYQGIDLAAG